MRTQLKNRQNKYFDDTSIKVDLAGPVQEWKDLAAVDDGSNQYLGDLCLSLRYVPSSGKLTGNLALHINDSRIKSYTFCSFAVAVLEARKLKKMDITGASDPYVKLKLFDQKQKRIGKKKKTSVKSCNLNPYWNESFVFIIEEMEMKRVTLDITVKLKGCLLTKAILSFAYFIRSATMI